MDQTVHIVIVMNDRNARETLADHLTSAGMPVTETDDIMDVPALMAKKIAIPQNLTSQNTYVQYYEDISSFTSNNLSNAHYILVVQNRSGYVQNIPKKTKKYMYKGMTLEEMERDHIVHTLQTNGWQIQHAAKELGIDRSTLYRKMKKYNISSH